MNMLIFTFTYCLILALFTLGVYISFRLLRFPDLTVEGTFVFSAAIVGVMLQRGYSSELSMLTAIISCSLAGASTGLLITKAKINPALSGLLIMAGLYALAIHVMGQNSIQLFESKTIQAELVNAFPYMDREIKLAHWQINSRDLIFFVFMLTLLIVGSLLMWLGLRTAWGTMLRTVSRNKRTMNSLGINTDNVVISGLALSGGISGLAGSLLAQYNGIVEIQSGIGMLLTGIAGILVGEMLFRGRTIPEIIFSIVSGAIVFRLLCIILTRIGWPTGNIRVLTVIIVLLLLIVPICVEKMIRRKKTEVENAGTE